VRDLVSGPRGLRLLLPPSSCPVSVKLTHVSAGSSSPGRDGADVGLGIGRRLGGRRAELLWRPQHLRARCRFQVMTVLHRSGVAVEPCEVRLSGRCISWRARGAKRMRRWIIVRILCPLVGLLVVASGGGGGIPGPATMTVSLTSMSQGNAPPSNVPRCVDVTDPLDSVPDSFYTLRGPASSTAAPGDLICSNEITAPAGDRAWVFLYWAGLSSGLSQVSGTLVINTTIPAPPAGRPVVSWAHGTPSSITDGCAPSRATPRPSGEYPPPPLSRFVNAGFAVVATDYVGLGTPGGHPYMVGKSEGAAVLAAARAAQAISPAQASGPVFIMGHSQGGHAALFADYLVPAASYGPRLDVRGVIALAPPTNLLEMARSVLTDLSGSSREARGNLLIVAGSWRQVYDLEYPAFLSDEAMALADYETDAAVQVCRMLQPSQVLVLDNLVRAGHHPELPEAWSGLLGFNSVPAKHFYFSRTIPLLVVQGKDDEQVPYPMTLAAVRDICESGVPVQFDKIAGGDHGAPVRSLSADRLILPWVQRRIRGDVENNCASLQSSAPPLTMYTVRERDTLWALAQTFHTAGGWKGLHHLNSDIIADADLIRPGQRLFIH
jgi:alpha-beta hydrolase superfamily lysophospholipase